MAKIQYTTTDGSTGEIDLNAEVITIGRAEDNLVVIHDDSLSSHHAQVSFDGSDWIITDLGSTNGTKVEGQPIDSAPLSHYPYFTLGSVDCIYYADEAYEESADAYASAPAAATFTHNEGYGALPYDPSHRTGFGPKPKAKGNGYAPLMVLGVISLLVSAAAAFLLSKLSV
jgi:hypothetical protein